HRRIRLSSYCHFPVDYPLCERLSPVTLTLSLHDALPIWAHRPRRRHGADRLHGGAGAGQRPVRGIDAPDPEPDPGLWLARARYRGLGGPPPDALRVERRLVSGPFPRARAVPRGPPVDPVRARLGVAAGADDADGRDPRGPEPGAGRAREPCGAPRRRALRGQHVWRGGGRGDGWLRVAPVAGEPGHDRGRGRVEPGAWLRRSRL